MGLASIRCFHQCHQNHPQSVYDPCDLRYSYLPNFTPAHILLLAQSTSKLKQMSLVSATFEWKADEMTMNLLEVYISSLIRTSTHVYIPVYMAYDNRTSLEIPIENYSERCHWRCSVSSVAVNSKVYADGSSRIINEWNAVKKATFCRQLRLGNGK